MSVQRVLDLDHFFCDTCRKFIYDESAGDATLDLAARTRVDDLPDSWTCPVCGASKDKLRAVTLVDEYASLKETDELRSDLEGEALSPVTLQVSPVGKTNVEEAQNARGLRSGSN